MLRYQIEKEPSSITQWTWSPETVGYVVYSNVTLSRGLPIDGGSWHSICLEDSHSCKNRYFSF
jgi:hypothetical protein